MPLRLNRNIVIMPSIEMKRTFHPVGQGAFYTEVFDCPNGDQKVVVYDCGTETGKTAFNNAGAKQLNGQIMDFANSLKPLTKHIDYLFISHFHDDHISGLLDLIKSLTPRCVVIPMLPMEMILATRISNWITYGQAAQPSDDLIQDLYLGNDDNRRAVHQFERVVPVKPTTWDGENEPLYPRGVHINRLELNDKDMGDFWLYRSFNSIAQEDSRAKSFISAIRKTIPMLLNGNTLVVQEIFNHLGELKKIYKKVMNKSSENLYTLVVESEPLRAATTLEDESLPGCVYFGDFVQDNKVWNRFLSEVNDYVEAVGIIQVPHHGAKDNWRQRMHNGTKISHCVISSGATNGHHHPSYWVVEEIQNSGLAAHVVYERPRSKYALTYLIK